MAHKQMMFHCLVLLQQTTVYGRDISDVNIALHKPARQSSTVNEYMHSYNGSASNAVDGGYNNSLFGNTCTMTSDAFLQVSAVWWEVDLLSLHTIGDIRILNTDSKKNYLHDVEIVLFEKKGDNRMEKKCTTYKGQAPPGWLNLTCDTHVSGRYVRIIKPKVLTTWHTVQDDVLTLCEVEIYEVHTSDNTRGNQKGISGLCILYKGISTGDDDTPMARSQLHCASFCGATIECTGFSFTGKVKNQNRWNKKILSEAAGITSFIFR